MLDFTESVFFRISRPLGTANAPVCEVLRQEANEELSYFHGPVFGGGGILNSLFFRVGSGLYQIWGGNRSIICAPKEAPFRFQISCFVPKSDRLKLD